MISKSIFRRMMSAAGVVAVAGTMLTSCEAEPDDSTLYTFTGFTIEEFLSSNENLSSFNRILTQVGYDRIMASYGAYTCFAPVNDAIDRYLDSLYNDKEKEIENPHNGMDGPGLEGILTGSEKADSLCLDIVKYHITGSSSTGAKAITVMDFTDKMNIPMLLGRSVIVHVDSISKKVGGPYLNKPQVYILNLDDPTESKTAVNGIIHVISEVIPRDNDLIGSRLSKMEKFSLFNEALERTGLVDSLLKTKKDRTYRKANPDAGHWVLPEDFESQIQFTIFAEPNEVYNANGIYTFDDLVAYANSVYGNAAQWYDYLNLSEDMQRVKIGNSVNTGTTNEDFQKRNNALNMFVAYHILGFGLRSDIVTTDYTVVPSGLHGCSGDSYDYYATMLPNTLVKAWRVNSKQATYLNRYVTNNTMTDELESLGSSGMHTTVYEGNEIDLGAAENPLNGFIYPIKDILVYNAQVPQGVLRERMRIDWMSVLPEIMSNDFRGRSTEDIAQRSGGTGVRIRFPNDFFDDVRVYNEDNTNLGMNVRGGYSLYQGDSFRHLGIVDYAIKLPPVPEGDYEMRLDFTLASHFGMIQYYIGRTNDPNDMQAIDIPMDCRMSYTDPRVGFTYALQEDNYSEDKGYTSDKALRNRGWMRGPLSVVRETQKRNETYFIRFTTHQLRRILIKQHFDQGDYWLRVKSVLSNVPEAASQLDYVEFVPLDLVQSTRYMEDMY